MKELLECTDLLANERVKAAYEGLGCDLGFQIWGHQTKPLLSSLADVAFAMRDACVRDISGYKWSCFIDTVSWWDTTPEEWIRAATLAWEKS